MTQLKLKTEYSFGKTYAPIDKIIERLVEINCTSAGIVDNSTWGHVAWDKACKKVGIAPLFGVECIVSDVDDLFLKMWFLARTTFGLQKLYQTMSQSYHQMIKSNRGELPRLYRSDVLNMGGDIYKFAGEVTDGEFLKDVDAVLDLNPGSRVLNSKKLSLSKGYGLRVVSVSDNAYINELDQEIFELISSAGAKPSDQHILTDLDYRARAGNIAIDCQGVELPTAPMVHAEGDLLWLCETGLKSRGCKLLQRWGNKYRERLQYELDLIRSKDFDSYFIIVADMVRYAKQHMLVGPSRGSAAGSLVCYLLGITEVDPIPAGLYFERFIDVNRTDLPDIDLDFPDKKRQMVFDYMAEKYGANKTAHIGTISRYRPLSAIIKICKALGISYSETAALKRNIIESAPGDARYNKRLKDTFKETDDGKYFAKDFPLAADACSKIEGHASHSGVHAAGLLICDDEITKYATVDNKGIAHVEKDAAEERGLLKIDVLGLRTLSILEDSGIDIDWYNLPFNDPVVFEIFNSGLLCGIFQFTGDAMRNVAKEIDFKTIDDINITVALARPGPLSSGIDQKYIARQNGQEYKLLHPSLKETHGLFVYQEQTMAVVHDIGGFNWEDTIAIRKAIAKSKGKEAIDKYFTQFLEGAFEHGLKKVEAHKIWEVINQMGAYQMNKAHTYSYAVISYWTAYLKAHHPLEFAAANLRNVKDEDAAIMLLREMNREGIEYIPFDLDLSEKNWSVQDGKLVGGFITLKGIGEKKAEKYIALRNEGKLTEKHIETVTRSFNPFADIFPFHDKYQHLYDEPSKNNILSEVYEISDIDNVPHTHERVFLGELIYKKRRNENEAVNIKKRKGRVAIGPLDYVNVRFRDDNGEIGGRIGVKDFETIGRDLLKNIPVGAHLVVRAKFFNGIRWAYITRFRRIDAHQE